MPPHRRIATARPAHGPGVLALTAFAALSAFAGSAHAQLQPEIGPQIRADPGTGTFASNETTGIASPFDPDEAVVGWNDWRRSPTVSNEIISCGFALTTDGGLTWNDFLIRPPLPNQSSVEGDPMTAADPRTGIIFAGGISFSAGFDSGIFVARKLPGETSFEPAVMARTTIGTDKPWMAAGPRPGLPDTTRVSVTYNEGIIWSDDLGLTWTPPTPLAGGIGLLPRVGPAGEVYVAYYNVGTDMRLLRSFDGGATFEDVLVAVRLDVWGVQDGSRAAGTFRIPSLASLAVDPTSGDLAYVYFDTSSVQFGQFDLDLYFTRSTDQGATWSDPVIIVQEGEGLEPADQLFPWIEYDDEGRLHLVYLDSRNDLQPDGGESGRYDAYYAFSVNDGATWTRHRLSPTTFDSTFDGLNRAQQFMGDYLGMGVAGDHAFPVYLDSSNGDTDVYTHRILLPVVGDVNGDRTVGFADLVALLAAWGPCPGPDPCPADTDGSGVIDLADLLTVLARWER